MEFRRKMWIKVSANNSKERAHTAPFLFTERFVADRRNGFKIKIL